MKTRILGSLFWTGLLIGTAVSAERADLPPDSAKLGADYRFAPDALKDIDLTSDTAWTLAIDGAAPRPIKVPGGGWNSDEQSPPIQTMKDVKDYVLYERKVLMPAEADSVHLIMRADGDGEDGLAFDQEFERDPVGEVDGDRVEFAESALQFMQAQGGVERIEFE